MTAPLPFEPFQARVRYAECDAWGELQPMHWTALFDSALADALRQQGVDLRELVRPQAVLRLAGVTLYIDQPLRYDDEVRIAVQGSRVDRHRWQVDMQALAARSDQLCARCTQTFAWRHGVEDAVLARLSAMSMPPGPSAGQP